MDTIDLDGAEQADAVWFSSFLSEPQVIVLETRPECIVENVRSLELWGDSIFVLDDRNCALYVFQMDGKYVRKVGDKGNGRGEYVSPADFSIDREKRVLYVWDEATRKVLAYDLPSLSHLSSTKIPLNDGQSYCLQVLGGSLYLNHASLEDGGGEHEILRYDRNDGKQVDAYVDAERYNRGWTLPLRQQFSAFYAKNTARPKYVGLFSNVIFSMTEEGGVPTYFVKSGDFATEEEVRGIAEAARRNGFVYDLSDLYERGRVSQISRYVEWDGKVCFQFLRGMERCYALHDEDTDSTVVTSLLLNDYVCDSCPIPMDFCYADGDLLVACLSQDYMGAFVEHVVGKGLLRTRINRYAQLAHLDAASNPVLFCFKPISH